MSTMHRPKGVSTSAGSQAAPRTPPRGIAKPQPSRTWTVAWTIAAPASAQGQLVWTIEADGAARCTLSQQNGIRDIGPAHRAVISLIDGLTHVTIVAGLDAAPLLAAVIDAATGTLLYAHTGVLTPLGVLGGRAEPPALSEIAMPARSAGR